MILLRAAALAALFTAPAAAQTDEPAFVAAPETDPLVLAARDRIKSDPAIADAVAQRVARSRLIGQITKDGGEEARVSAARAWVENDPDSAARVALGLAADDRAGQSSYEDTLLRQMSLAYDDNPGAQRNLYNRLRRSAKDSRLVKKQAEGLSADEQSEILRTMFEGKGSQAASVISAKGKEGGKIPEAAAPATAFSGIYDRLGAGNLRGYSPQLLALQSALNARRPPGAPPLVETGKLDYATLSYPAFAMSHDVENLEKRLVQDRILELARLSGRTLSARDWNDPELERKLAAAQASAPMSPGLARRTQAAAKARAALDSFRAAAEKSRDPAAISRALLVELGGKQKEAARWITVAALEEELSRLEPLDGFLTAELRSDVSAVPAPAAARAAYESRGEGLKAKLARAQACLQEALKLLLSEDWAARLAKADRLISEGRAQKADLPRDIDDYSRLPRDIARARLRQPRWREILDDLAVKWAPSLSYARAVSRRRERLARLIGAFGLIAAGDAAGARAALGAPSEAR